LGVDLAGADDEFNYGVIKNLVIFCLGRALQIIAISLLASFQHFVVVDSSYATRMVGISIIFHTITW
jgi:hypothetical protein